MKLSARPARGNLLNVRLVDESGYAGRVAKISAFTTSGVFTKSEGAKFALVRAVGGGGGGGGTAGVSNQQAVGAAGESGGYIEAWIDLASVTSLPVTIGSAGAGGAAGANFGSSGGTTSLGTLVTCPGGNGGPGGSSSSGVPSLNSDYGSESTVAPSTTGKLIASIRSKRDSYRMALSLAAVIGGCGGSSPFGRGGAPGSADSGKDGQGYGSGGGGASSTGTSFKGGNGTPGIMIIQEYF
ncbi:glycine-rich domain-containing protein [Escherichia coli]